MSSAGRGVLPTPCLHVPAVAGCHHLWFTSRGCANCQPAPWEDDGSCCRLEPCPLPHYVHEGARWLWPSQASWWAIKWMLGKPTAPKSFPVLLRMLWSSENSAGRKDSDGNFSSLNCQGWQLEGRSLAGGDDILQLLNLKPPEKASFRNSSQTFLKTKYCLESSNRLL